MDKVHTEYPVEYEIVMAYEECMGSVGGIGRCVCMCVSVCECMGV